jgi:hypothetical protein
MVPNFYDQLNLKNDHRTVAAGGPCNWEDGDASAEVKNVTVTQGSVTGSSGTASTTVRKGTDTDWWLDVNSANQFTRAPAQTRAVAIVTRTDGTTYEHPWPDNVQLH